MSMLGCLKKVLLKACGLAPREAQKKPSLLRASKEERAPSSKITATERLNTRAAKKAQSKARKMKVTKSAKKAAKAAAKAARAAEKPAKTGKANQALKVDMMTAAAVVQKPATAEARPSIALEQLRPRILSPLYIAKSVSVRGASFDKENVVNSSPMSDAEEGSGDKLTPLKPLLFPAYAQAKRLGSADSQLTSYSSLGGEFDYGSDVDVEPVTPVKLNMGN